MGSFLVNFHVRTGEVGSIDELLASLDDENRRTEPEAGWVSVYEARASTQDPAWIAELACRLSASAEASTVAFLVHDSDAMQCWLAEGGALQTHLDSWPGFPDDEPEPRFESPTALLALCGDLDLAGLSALFAGDVVFAEELVMALAQDLGIATERALVDFRHDDDGGDLLGAGDSGRGRGRDGFDPDALRALIEQQNPVAVDASAEDVELVEAAHAGDTEAVRALLDAGISTEGQAPWRPESARSGPTAGFHPQIAVTPLFVASFENHLEIIRLLLEHGADPNGQIPQGGGPLAAAACAGHLAAVEELLAGGANPLAVDAAGKTPSQAVAATREQLKMFAGAIGDLGPITDLPFALPDDADLEACARALEDVASR